MIQAYVAKRFSELLTGNSNDTAVCLGSQIMGFRGESFGFGDDAGLFFKGLGFSKYHSVDYNGDGTLTLDLGVPLPEGLAGMAKLVFDGGTIEHIPDIYQAFRNGISMVKVGGYYAAHSPINQFDNCYWNINPEFYLTQLPAAGFEIVHCEVAVNCNLFERLGFLLQRTLPSRILKPIQSGQGANTRKGIIPWLFAISHPLRLSPNGLGWNVVRTVFVPEATSVFVIAKKIADVKPKAVDQSFYRRDQTAK